MSEPLRIGYLTSTFARPSDTFIRNEVNQLRGLGVEVATFSIRRPEQGGELEPDVCHHQQSTEYLLDRGFAPVFAKAALAAVMHPIRFLRTMRLAMTTAAPGVRGFVLQGAYLAEAICLASQLRTRQIQLLHNHIGENSATVAMLASEFSGIPFSLTIHGPYVFYAPQKWALSEKLGRAAFTACISHFCRSQCLAFAPESAWPRLHVMRCSVQPEFLELPAGDEVPRNPQFICVGRLCREKGQSLLVEAARRLADDGLRFQLLLVGDGPSRPVLENLIQELKVGEFVRILGWRSSAQVRDLMLKSTALIIPSFAEGLPIVAMEALAMRRPVIATNIAAMSELIENDHCGWLIPPGSVDHLALAMKTAAASTPSKLQAMGEHGRARVLELHDPIQQAKELQALFVAAIDRTLDCRI
jgi:glycosyltransferase involved in cell wall biosynthesis